MSHRPDNLFPLSLAHIPRKRQRGRAIQLAADAGVSVTTSAEVEGVA